MKKTILIIFVFIISIKSYSQVGINTENPKATLDVIASPNDGNKTDGFIAPRLKGSELKAKDALYTAAQDGAIVYVTEAVSGVTDKTTNVTSIGYYYFDKTQGTAGRWARFNTDKPVTFFKSNTNQYVADVLNNNPGTNVVATFTGSDALVNQASSFDSSTSYFTLLQSGLYEFSGTICFNPGRFYVNDTEGHGALTVDQRVIINIQIQYSIDGGNTWSGITGMRMIYNSSSADLNVPITTPISMRELSAGTLIRLVLNRPNITNEQVAGTDSSIGNPTSYQNINMPTGLDFTKLIKIQKLQ